MDTEVVCQDKCSKKLYLPYSASRQQKKQNSIKLRIDGSLLKHNSNSTYLGITFDQKMTWKQQIDKVEKRAKTRLTLMRKLSGASWGADHNTQKKVYTGYVRPVLEYGIATWGTAAKSHFDKVKRIQN